MDFVLLLVITFILLSVTKTNNYQHQTLSIQSTSNLQAIAVIFVLLHHLSQVLKDYPDSFLSSRLIIVGRLSVGVFFFISGYGLIKQYKKKEQKYLDDFLRKKFTTLLVPFIFAAIIYFIYRNLIGNYSVRDSLYSLVNGNPVVINGWFVIMILYLYLCFYISALIAKNNFSILIIVNILLVLIAMIIAIKFNYGEWWINALFCFPLGLTWSCHEKSITSFLLRHYKNTLFVLAFLFSISFYLDEIIPTLAFRSLSVIFFVTLIISISYKINFCNDIFPKIKMISFELYLYQGMFIQLFRGRLLFVGNRLIYVCLVFLCALFFSYIMHKASNFIVKLFQKNNKYFEIN